MPTAVLPSSRIGATSVACVFAMLIVKRLPTTIWDPALAKLRRLAA